MTKLLAILLASLTFLLGLGTGAQYVARRSDAMERTLKIWAQEDRADIAIRALRHIRQSSTNTAAFLESQLDDALVSLGRIISTEPESQRSQGEFRMLKIARDYRTEFPHKSDQPGVDEGVARAFALMAGKAAN